MFQLVISDTDNFSFFIPEGFAHGFLCLSKSVQLIINVQL